MDRGRGIIARGMARGARDDVIITHSEGEGRGVTWEEWELCGCAQVWSGRSGMNGMGVDGRGRQLGGPDEEEVEGVS